MAERLARKDDLRTMDAASAAMPPIRKGTRGYEARLRRKRTVTRSNSTRYVRATIQRSLYYFAQYVDYRYSDPLYPDSSPGRFQVMECLFEDCGGLFIRSPKTLLYSSDDCARKDAGGGS